MCNRRSAIRAFVEKKTGLDGSRTLIHSGFLAWCNDGSIFEQVISEIKLPAREPKSNQARIDRTSGVTKENPACAQHFESQLTLGELESLPRTGLTRFLAFFHPWIACKETFLLQCRPQCGVMFEQSSRNRQTNGARLPCDSATRRFYLDVERVTRFGHLKRLQNGKLQ